ncbi:hypothetical protein GO755_26840 [Spirosoma sp. HMF4905]|uniref:Uncharacterized protein n=1 Tax=Spirosoma arboris TaxID=2682092 RepID=A0A7K1SIU5_9BACT|nr:hypothetical protein [Spirosoma arboris]MVM33685.1 hypothetical protein [Spirosoma arboris]
MAQRSMNPTTEKVRGATLPDWGTDHDKRVTKGLTHRKHHSTSHSTAPVPKN